MDKPLRIYQCEDTFNGILSAVYDAGISGYGHDYIKIQPISDDSLYNIELFSEYINVDTSQKKADSVLNAIRTKISYEAYEFVLNALISDDEAKGNIIYQFVTYGFTIGKNITKAMQLNCVEKIFKIKLSVQNEAHRLIEFIRFKELQNKVLFAQMEPHHHILPIVTNHFADRFNAQDFIIHDIKHNEASFYRNDGMWEIKILNKEETAKLNELASKDEEYADLWKIFFKATSTAERENYKLQRGNLPIRLRKHMTEFE